MNNANNNQYTLRYHIYKLSQNIISNIKAKHIDLPSEDDPNRDECIKKAAIELASAAVLFDDYGRDNQNADLDETELIKLAKAKNISLAIDTTFMTAFLNLKKDLSDQELSDGFDYTTGRAEELLTDYDFLEEYEQAYILGGNTKQEMQDATRAYNKKMPPMLINGINNGIKLSTHSPNKAVILAVFLSTLFFPILLIAVSLYSGAVLKALRDKKQFISRFGEKSDISKVVPLVNKALAHKTKSNTEEVIYTSDNRTTERSAFRSKNPLQASKEWTKQSQKIIDAFKQSLNTLGTELDVDHSNGRVSAGVKDLRPIRDKLKSAESPKYANQKVLIGTAKMVCSASSKNIFELFGANDLDANAMLGCVKENQGLRNYLNQILRTQLANREELQKKPHERMDHVHTALINEGADTQPVLTCHVGCRDIFQRINPLELIKLIACIAETKPSIGLPEQVNDQTLFDYLEKCKAEQSCVSKDDDPNISKWLEANKKNVAASTPSTPKDSFDAKTNEEEAKNALAQLDIDNKEVVDFIVDKARENTEITYKIDGVDKKGPKGARVIEILQEMVSIVGDNGSLKESARKLISDYADPTNKMKLYPALKQLRLAKLKDLVNSKRVTQDEKGKLNSQIDELNLKTHDDFTAVQEELSGESLSTFDDCSTYLTIVKLVLVVESLCGDSETFDSENIEEAFSEDQGQASKVIKALEDVQNRVNRSIPTEASRLREGARQICNMNKEEVTVGDIIKQLESLAKSPPNMLPEFKKVGPTGSKKTQTALEKSESKTQVTKPGGQLTSTR